MKKLSIVIALLVSAIGIAQVDVIGPADGVLFDTKTSTVLNGIGNPREGLLVGNKTTHSLWYYNGTEFVDLMDVVGGTTYTASNGLSLTGTDFGIADAGVTNLKLQNGSITNDKIAFFTINPTRLNVNVNQNPVPADMVPVTLTTDEFTFKPYITSPFSSSITGYRFAPNLLYFDQIHIKNKTQDNSVATSSITLSSVEDPNISGDYYGYIGLAKPSTGAGDRITGVPSSYSVLGTTNNVKIGQATSTAPAEKLFVEGNIDITGDYLINGTPIGPSGGTDDQTLSEVLAEGKDAGGEDVLNVGILNLSDKNSDTGTWDITEQTSSTYSGDLAFRNSSAGSSINRAFIPHDGIIEFSAHLTTKFYVDNAISNSGGGSDSGQGKEALESGNTGELVTYDNNNVTVDGNPISKGIINEIFAQDTISLSGVTLKNFWIPIQNYTDSLRLIRNADEWFDVKDSVLKSTDFLKTGQKEMILARYRKDSANIKLWEIKVPSYVLADTTAAYVNPNPELFDLTYASTIGSGSNNVRTPSGGLEKIVESTGATFDVVFDDTVPTGDDYVIEVTANNTGSNERARHFLSPVTVGEVYEYKIWMKVTENPGNGRLLRYDGVDNKNIVYGATNTDWELFEGEFTAQATEVQLNYGFVANEATASKIRVKASMKLKDD
tara:strand:+ start:2913 stop:4907 length:1995 start_codon:yes stop_codon:yes gene_type:complete